MSTIPAIPVRRSQRISSNDLTPSKITSSLNQSTPGRTTARRNLQQRLQSQLQSEISKRNESEAEMHNIPIRRAIITHQHNPLPSDVSISDLLEETPSRFFAPPSVNNNTITGGRGGHDINTFNNDFDRSTTPTTRPSNRRKSALSNINSSRKKKTTIITSSTTDKSSTLSIINSSSIIIKFLWKSLEMLFKITIFILTPIAKILFSSGKGFGKLMFYATPKSRKLRTNIIARWKLIVTFLLILFLSYFAFQFRKRGSDLSTITSLQHQLLNLDKRVKDSQTSFDQYIQSLTEDVMRINQQSSEYFIALDKLKSDQIKEIGNLEKNQNLISDSLTSIDMRTRKYNLQHDRITLTMNEIMEKMMEISKNKNQEQQLSSLSNDNPYTPPSSSHDHHQQHQQHQIEKEDYFEITYNRIKNELLREIDSLYFDKDRILELLNDFKSTISMANSDSLSKLSPSASQPSSPSFSFGSIGNTVPQSISMVNYANNALGTRIIKKLTSKTFEEGGSFPTLNKFGLGYLSKLFTLDGLSCYGPAVTLNNRLDLGNCWPLKGNQGQIAIQLHDSIFVTHFSIGHSREGPNQLSAPKDIELYAFVTSNTTTTLADKEGINNKKDTKDNDRKVDGEEGEGEEKLVFITKKTYDIQSPLDVQTFEINKPIKSSKFIFKINNNHGHANYTCIYRIGLHSQTQIQK